MGRTICHRLIPLSPRHLEDGEEKEPNEYKSKGSEFHEERGKEERKTSDEESAKKRSRRAR